MSQFEKPSSINPPIEPVPPKNQRSAGHHWLEKRDIDGHTFGLVVLQWCPGAKRWSHSGHVGSDIYVDTSYWLYEAPCPMPGETY